MTSRKYFLADLIFNIDFDINFNISTNTIYEYNNLYNDKSNIRIIFTLDEIIKKAKKINNNISIDCVNTIDGNIVSLYDDKGFVAHNINATNNWQDIIVKSSMPQKIPFLGSAGEVIFRTSILFHKGFVIHASAIEVKGKGIIFSAPSGTGKSTQADLWVKHRGAKILNGDRPAIRIFDDGVRVYGTPWCGTSNQHLNMSAPLEAIFLLEQSPLNEVLIISTQEAIQRITARCYLPYFNEELMGLALDNIGAVIQKTPVYLLKCRPDSDAVDVVASCLGL